MTTPSTTLAAAVQPELVRRMYVTSFRWLPLTGAPGVNITNSAVDPSDAMLPGGLP